MNCNLGWIRSTAPAQIIAGALALMLWCHALAAAPSGDSAAIVNGVAIPVSAVKALVEQGVRNGMPRSPQSNVLARDELVRREVLWQEARKLGYENSPGVVAVVDEQQQKNVSLPAASYQTLVAREYLKDFATKHPIQESALKSTYGAMVAQGKRTEYHVKDIAVGSRTEALVVLQKIAGGESFEDVALKSPDVHLRSSGGDLGWGSAARFHPEIVRVLDTLDKGRVAKKPVQIGTTFHVLKLEDRRRREPTPFETMKPLLLKQLQDEQAEDLVKRLSARAKIVYPKPSALAARN